MSTNLIQVYINFDIAQTFQCNFQIFSKIHVLTIFGRFGRLRYGKFSCKPIDKFELIYNYGITKFIYKIVENESLEMETKINFECMCGVK